MQELRKAPFIHSHASIQKVMLDVIIALAPAAAAAVYFFGLSAAMVIGAGITSCVAAEFAWQKLLKKPVRVGDLSAFVTGLLLALTLPPSLPLWLVILGGFFAVIFGKMVFGGLGNNLLNPALAARAFLQLAWPHLMISWVKPFDAVTTATPLTINKYMLPDAMPSYLDMLLGNRGGSLGETCVLALAAGGIFLIMRKDIFALIPVTFIATVAAGAVIFGQDPILFVLGGGLMLGAFFMATDPATSPVSTSGKFIFALGCGIITVFIRVKGGFSEGVCFSILIMNLAVPALDKLLIPKPFGAALDKMHA